MHFSLVVILLDVFCSSQVMSLKMQRASPGPKSEASSTSWISQKPFEIDEGCAVLLEGLHRSTTFIQLPSLMRSQLPVYGKTQSTMYREGDVSMLPVASVSCLLFALVALMVHSVLKKSWSGMGTLMLY